MKTNNIVLLSIIVLIVSFFYLTTKVNTINEGYDNDGMYYASQVSNEGILSIVNPKTAPFCYRVFTPFIVSLTPLNTLDGFRFVAFISDCLNLFFLSQILLLLGFSYRYVLCGVAFFIGIFWTLKISFFSPCYVDYQVMLFILMHLYFTLRKKYIVAILVSSLAIFQKDSLLFLPFVSMAYYYESNNRKFSRNFILISIVSIVIPISVFIYLRSVVDAVNSYSLSSTMVDNINILLNTENFGWKLSGELISGLSLLSVFPFLYLMNYPINFNRVNLIWWVYLIFSFIFLFGGVDKARLLMYLILPIIILSLKLIINVQAKLEQETFILWLTLTFLLHFSLGNVLINFNDPADYISKMVPIYFPEFKYAYHILNIIFMLFYIILTQFILQKSATSADSNK